MPESDETFNDYENPLPEAVDPLIGSEWESRYEIVEKIGQGGMGRIYKAHHKYLDETVAIKLMHQGLLSSQRSLQRFKQEAKSLGKLKHNNLVKLLSMGISKDGAPYLVLEYLNGKSLATILHEEGMLSAERTVSLLKQICQGLQYAHTAKIIHRDLKPNNIILVKETDKNETIKIVDFGIAYLLSESSPKQHLTQTGAALGSPDYMSPEQIQGLPLDGRADIYSVGCLAYEVLTGKPPFHDENALMTMNRHLNESAESLPFPKPIPRDLHSLVIKALAKDPDQRFQNMAEVLAALDAINPEDQISTQKPRGKFKMPQQSPILSIIIYGAAALSIAAYAYHVARRMLHQSADSFTKSTGPSTSLLKSPRLPDAKYLEKEIPDYAKRIDYYRIWLRMYRGNANTPIKDLYRACSESADLRSKLNLAAPVDALKDAQYYIVLYQHSLNPKDEDYWLNMCEAKVAEARCCLRLKEYAKARFSLQQSLEICKNNLQDPLLKKIELLTLMGDIYHHEKKYTEAEKCYLDCDKLIPPDSNKDEAFLNHFHLAANYMAMGKKESCLHWLNLCEQEYEERHPSPRETKAFFLSRFAELYTKAGDYPKALETSLKELKTRLGLAHPNITSLMHSYDRCGRLLAQTGDTTGSDKMFEDGYQDIFERCKHERRGLLEPGQQSFREQAVVRCSNNYSRALLLLAHYATCLSSQARYADADKVFARGYKLLKTAPTSYPDSYAEFLINYTNFLDSRKQYAKAQTVIEDAESSFYRPNKNDKNAELDIRSLTFLKIAAASSYFRSGKLDDADRSCQEANGLLQQMPSNEQNFKNILTQLQTAINNLKSLRAQK